MLTAVWKSMELKATTSLMLTIICEQKNTASENVAIIMKMLKRKKKHESLELDTSDLTASHRTSATFKSLYFVVTW